ncbi:MAG: hypothetical protein R6V12_01415 [Candidatus Hydrogenedentota bacterium]
MGWFLKLGFFVLVGVAGAGLASAPHFLEMEAWSRPVLESLTWVVLVFVLALALLLNVMVFGAQDAVIAQFSLVLNLITLFSAAPLGLMIVHLRSETVRAAMVQPWSDKSDGSDRSDGSVR